jgi:hypothetical protein
MKPDVFWKVVIFSSTLKGKKKESDTERQSSWDTWKPNCSRGHAWSRWRVSFSRFGVRATGAEDETKSSSFFKRRKQKKTNSEELLRMEVE